MPEKKIKEINDLILKAAKKAYKETSGEAEPDLTKPIDWPVNCVVGPGLEGAIACETEIGYVNGSKGWLIYRGYDIFELCAKSTYEEVSFLLLHGHLPNNDELAEFEAKLKKYRHIPNTQRLLMSFPVETMNPMSALRLGTNLMRQEVTYRDMDDVVAEKRNVISSDEDSIPMETEPMGERHAIYEFKKAKKKKKVKAKDGSELGYGEGIEACYHLIAAVPVIAATVARLRSGRLPIEPDPDLGHAANFIYMMTGNKPTTLQEKVMDVSLILHADHGMNASTFASMVVASTLSDIYLSIGSGIAALNGPLHGGANEEVLKLLQEIGDSKKVPGWYAKARKNKRKIMGFGHRVYKAYDPRARVLGPLAEHLVKSDPESKKLFDTAKALENEVVSTLGVEKKIFPNVDFYSGIVYSCLGIPSDMFTPVFAVSRVAGWTSRVIEYLEKNRIFRPRAMYTGSFDKKYTPINKR